MKSTELRRRGEEPGRTNGGRGKGGGNEGEEEEEIERWREGGNRLLGEIILTMLNTRNEKG